MKQSTLERRTALERRRNAHHAALGSLIGGDIQAGYKLWRALRRIERHLYPICLDYTNGDNGIELVHWERAKDMARLDLLAVFRGQLPAGLFINGDPRGHMLKLDCDARPIPDGMERDWGGNGILAADINDNTTPARSPAGL